MENIVKPYHNSIISLSLSKRGKDMAVFMSERKHDNNSYDIVVDTVADIASIDTGKMKGGTTLYVIDTKQAFILGSNGWKDL